MRYRWNAADRKMLAQPLALMLALMLALVLAHAQAWVLSPCQHYCRKPRDARGLAAPLARACHRQRDRQGGNTDRLGQCARDSDAAQTRKETKAHRVTRCEMDHSCVALR